MTPAELTALAGTATALIELMRDFIAFDCEDCDRGIWKGDPDAARFCTCCAGHARAVLELHDRGDLVKAWERAVIARAAGGNPDEVRLIRVTRETILRFGARTLEGDRLTGEWGEPDIWGIYTPAITRRTDDNLVAPLRKTLHDVRAGLEQLLAHKPEHFSAQRQIARGLIARIDQ